jgi:hypothetical protein
MSCSGTLGRLQKVQEFSIPSDHAEGIAFVPDSKDISIVNLYVAANNQETQRTSIDVYQISSSPVTTVQNVTAESLELTRKSLNANLLTHDLEDAKDCLFDLL